MGTRFYSVIVVGIAAILVTVVNTLPATGTAAPIVAPPSANVPSERLDLTWVFGMEEALSCDPPSSVLRGLKYRLGDLVHVSALFVGDDTARARRFLATERLPIPVEIISRDEYHARYRGQDLPVVTASDGRQRVVLPKSAWVLGEDKPISELESVVTRMAARLRAAQQ